jgi:predicted Mrr-cat superfamily restriction endonuclease
LIYDISRNRIDKYDASTNAKAAAEKSQKQIRIMGWEEFVELFLEVYDKVDNEFKARVPLENIRMLRPSIEETEEI